MNNCMKTKSAPDLSSTQATSIPGYCTFIFGVTNILVHHSITGATYVFSFLHDYSSSGATYVFSFPHDYSSSSGRNLFQKWKN